MESMDEQEQGMTQGARAKTDEEGVSNSSSRAEGLSSFMGKHRMAAAISNLHNQISLIQAELNELETFGQASLVCNQLISGVESVPDPLLPRTKGPADDSWDRWFRGGGAHNFRTHKRWI